jgi:hypothetical protein
VTLEIVGFGVSCFAFGFSLGIFVMQRILR